jgi:cytochrome c biogenesis protein CcmG/thiol:disulfide interchange protein DsbE
LRGYPIVLNAWGSWCGPCQAEFGLFAAASARYGRRVAFLGADVNDVASDARAFLAQHPVSYPSYQMSSDQITPILPPGLAGTPTTIFIGPTGKLVDVHVGQYQSQGSLDADIQADALPG